MKSSDVELVERACEGDRAAFEALVERYRDAVCGVAYHHLGNFDDVQDAAQEAFVHAYLRLAQLRDPEKFGPCLRKIASNVSVTRLRSRDRSEVELYEADEVRCSDSDPHRSAVRIIVRDALAKLSEKTRLTVTLACINGYSHGEIASFLEVPINTVRSRLRIAKTKLREEMIGMVSDSLHEDKPDEALVKRITDSIVRYRQAWESGTTEDLLGCIDNQLQAIDAMEAGPHPEELQRQLISAGEQAFCKDMAQEAREQLERVKSLPPREFFKLTRRDLMRNKADVITRLGQDNEYGGMLEDYLRTLEESGDLEWKAEALGRRAGQYASENNGALAMEYYRRAADAFAEVDDKAGQAESLWSLAHLLLLEERKAAEARDFYAQALGLWEQTARRDFEGMCRAELQCVKEVQDHLDRLVEWSPSSVQLRRKAKATEMVVETAWTWAHPDLPPTLKTGHIFTQIGWNTRFLDPSKRLGKSSRIKYTWDRSFAGTYITIINVSKNEHVDVPAGSFDNCLLTEIKVEGHIPRTNGTRLAWYAHGIGLVQFEAKMDDGTESLIQLHEYSIVEPSTDYLPLAISNSWTYGWADIPENYVAKEAYRVAATDGDLWYLDHYHYVYQKPKTCPDV